MCNNETNGPAYEPFDFSDLEDDLDNVEVFDVSDLEEDLDKVETKEDFLDQAVEFARKPCIRCGGTGAWRGIRRCFTCNGSGKSNRKIRVDAEGVKNREKARTYRANAKKKKGLKMVETAETYMKANPEVSAWIIAGMKKKNDFAISLLAAIYKYGSLTDGQKAAVEKAIARDAEQAQAAEDNAPTIENFAPVMEFFRNANTRIKFPKVLLEFENDDPIMLKLAGSKSKNAGSLYITDGGPFGANVYYGRVSPEGKVMLSREGDRRSAELVGILTGIAERPQDIAATYGKKTGACCFCRKDLRDPASVFAGYGPTCADNWGLPHGETGE